MKPIDDEFTKNGWHHRLLERGGQACIFRRWKDDRFPHFEVVLLTEQKQVEFPPGVVRVAHEAYPSAEQWGSKGWTFTDLGNARDKFASLLGARQLT